MKEKIVYVSGMFRCGTTLLGKCIGSHPNIAFGLDIFQEIFREIRNKIIPSDVEFNSDSPFHHNFWDDMSWKKTKIPNVDFKKLNLNKKELQNLLNKVSRRAKLGSPALCEKIKKIQAENIQQLFEECFNIIKETYGTNKKVEYIGFKENWGEEFAPALINNFPNTKVIHIIRDPRAVTSSRLAQKEQYPFLFIARFWRKSATQAILWSKIYKEYSDKYLVVRYEDLITNPKETLRSISKFLGIKFSEEMINYQLPDKNAGYAEGANSSYSSMLNKKGFVKEAINRWERELTNEQKNLIKWLTYPEILYYDYIQDKVPLVPSVLSKSHEISKNKIAEWIKPYEIKYLTDKNYQKTEYSKEIIRHLIFELANTKYIKDFPDKLIEKCYYDKQYFNHIKKQILG